MSQSRKSLLPGENPFDDLPMLDLGDGIPMAEVPPGAMLMSNDFLSEVADRQSNFNALQFFAEADRDGLVFISSATVHERAWGLVRGSTRGAKVVKEKARAFHAFLSTFEPSRVVQQGTWDEALLLAEGFNLKGVRDLYSETSLSNATRLRTDLIVSLQAWRHEMLVVSSAVDRFLKLRDAVPFPGVIDPETRAVHR